MAAQLFSGRSLSKSLATSLVAFLALSFGAAEPVRAGHFLTHPAAQSAGTPAGPSAVTQVATQAGTPSAARNAARNAAQNAAPASNRAAALFRNGAEIKIRKDANLYITARNIPKNDRLLAAYNADRPNGGRVQTRLGEATAAPGLLGIANQAYRAQDPDGRNAQAYSLADAMRDAIWRKQTAARLKSLTTAQNACAGGAGGAGGIAKRTLSIGLAARLLRVVRGGLGAPWPPRRHRVQCPAGFQAAPGVRRTVRAARALPRTPDRPGSR